jgi:hypothetical protein
MFELDEVVEELRKWKIWEKFISKKKLKKLPEKILRKFSKKIKNLKKFVKVFFLKTSKIEIIIFSCKLYGFFIFLPLNYTINPKPLKLLIIFNQFLKFFFLQVVLSNFNPPSSQQIIYPENLSPSSSPTFYHFDVIIRKKQNL